jgi:hypothetical protein
MHLTKEEERLLESENRTITKSMEILVALGEIFGAEKLVTIKSAHISGISYQNIGEAGLEWLEGLDARVKVRTTVNPAGMDVEKWKEMVDEAFYRKQMRIIGALKKMGAELTLTCTPYYIYPPSYGDNLAWSESSAIIYANSVIGARTNRESGISAIAAAMIGKTACYGMHIKENRAPNVLVKVKKLSDVSALGFQLGSMLKNEIPLLRLPRKLNSDELKLLGAAMAATGNMAMFHVEGQTPEWRDFQIPKERIELDAEEIGFDCNPDLIALGCPHLSRDELLKVLEILQKEGKKVKRDVWLFTSRKLSKENAKLVEKIEGFGVKVFSDTCMVVSPVVSSYECVMVNSAKALMYLPRLRRVEVSFGCLEECIRRALQ